VKTTVDHAVACIDALGRYLKSREVARWDEHAARRELADALTTLLEAVVDRSMTQAILNRAEEFTGTGEAEGYTRRGADLRFPPAGAACTCYRATQAFPENLPHARGCPCFPVDAGRRS